MKQNVALATVASDSILNTSLNLVHEHISHALEEATRQIELIHEAPEGADLSNCLQLLRQVHGVLNLLQLEDVALLTEELENFTQALMAGKVLQHHSAFELMIGAMLFIPRYIEYVQTHHQRNAVLLMPTINALRIVRRAGFIPEHVFAKFSVQTAKLPMVADPIPATADLDLRIRRIRHMYQVGLLGVFRGVAVATHVKYMTRVVDQLEKLCGRQPFNEIWWITLGLLEAVSDQGLRLDTSVKHMLGVVDRQIKQVVDGGSEVLSRPVNDKVRDALLYYIAKSTSNGPLVSTLKLNFRLRAAVCSEDVLESEREKLAAPDRSVLKKVAQEIKQSLHAIMAQLDEWEANKEKLTVLAEIPVELNKTSVTLDVLNLTHAAHKVKQLAILFEQICERKQRIDDAEFARIAETLLYVELALDEYSHGGIVPNDTSAGLTVAYQEAQRTVVKEARVIIDQVKNALDSYFTADNDNEGDAREIKRVPDWLQTIRGALWVMQLQRAANIVAACSQIIRTRFLEENQLADAAEKDAIADVLSSIEWYLEVYELHQQTDGSLLDVATASLLELGWITD